MLHTTLQAPLSAFSPEHTLQLIRVFPCILLLWCYYHPLPFDSPQSTRGWRRCCSLRNEQTEPTSEHILFPISLFGALLEGIPSRLLRGALEAPRSPHTLLLSFHDVDHSDVHQITFLSVPDRGEVSLSPSSLSTSHSRSFSDPSGMYIHKLFPYF